MSEICTKCKKEISIFDMPNYPAGLIKQHPELAGMCWQCFLEWKGGISCE
jgi:hypothetical protein